MKIRSCIFSILGILLTIDALSVGGNITMDPQDMFWGAYYDSCTDKYGVRWMFNCNDK